MIKSQKLYNLENVEDVIASLNNIKPKQNSLTAKEVVERLIEPITHALSMRYSFKEIAEIVFNANGCKISANALKTSYEELTNTKKPRKKRVSRIIDTIEDSNNERI